MIVNLLLLISGFIYFATLIVIYILSKREPQKVSNDRIEDFVSILVCARNEEKTIHKLLESLQDLSYEQSRYEVILIDDGSEDSTFNIMNEYARENSNWYCYRNKLGDKSLKGKKKAITFGIKKCRGEIVLTTDADCVVPPGWIQSMVGFFKDRTVGMVLGHSPVRKEKGFVNKLQRFDAVCESVVALATSVINRPFHSNGRNLAYRKELFFEVGGYNDNKEIASGDDFFLSKKIAETGKYRFVYNTSPESFVETEPTKGWFKYVFQQLRRNSKAFYLPVDYFLLALNAFLFHLFMAMSFVFGYVTIPAFALVAKFVVEFIPVYRGLKVFGASDLLVYYPLLWLAYPFVMIISASVGSLFKFHSWR